MEFGGDLGLKDYEDFHVRILEVSREGFGGSARFDGILMTVGGILGFRLRMKVWGEFFGFESGIWSF